MRILKTAGALWLAAGLAFITWQWNTYRAHGIDNSVFQNSDSVTVTDNSGLITFSPSVAPTKTLIFFPGALVAPEAYAPLMRKIAEAGYEAVLVKMPFRMAQYGYDRPEVIRLFADPEMKYCLAGHSKGAAMAASFVAQNTAQIDALVLIGTTHPRDFDLSGITIPVAKIYGTEDGVAQTAKVMENKKLLPSQTKFTPIKGGNHSQFAYYGNQIGDNPASISRTTQQELTLAALLQTLKEM